MATPASRRQTNKMKKVPTAATRCLQKPFITLKALLRHRWDRKSLVSVPTGILPATVECHPIIPPLLSFLLYVTINISVIFVKEQGLFIVQHLKHGTADSFADDARSRIV